MDAAACYTMVPTVHANLVHPVSWRADKVVTVSLISRNARWFALKVAVIGKIMPGASCDVGGCFRDGDFSSSLNSTQTRARDFIALVRA